MQAEQTIPNLSLEPFLPMCTGSSKLLGKSPHAGACESAFNHDGWRFVPQLLCKLALREVAQKLLAGTAHCTQVFYQQQLQDLHNVHSFVCRAHYTPQATFLEPTERCVAPSRS